MNVEENGIQVIGSLGNVPFETSLEIEHTDDDAVIEDGSETEEQEEEDVEGGELDGLDVEEQEESEEGDDPYENYTDAQILALSYIEDGILPEDLDISELDAVQLKEKVLESLQKTADSRAEENLKKRVPTEEHYDYAEMLFNGATDEETVYARTLDQLSSLDIELEDDAGETTRRHVIEQHYIARGFNETKAKKLTEVHFQEGEDLEEAKAAQDYFKNESKTLKTQLKESAELKRQEQDRKHQEFRDTVKSKIEEGKFGDVELTDKEKKKMLPALFEPTEVVETADGKSVKVSLYQKMMHEIQNDVDKQLLLAKIVLFDDLNTEKIVSRAKNKSNRDLLSKLDGKTTVRPKPSNKPKQTIKRDIQPLRTIGMG